MKAYALEIGPTGRLHWVWAENPGHEPGFGMDAALSASFAPIVRVALLSR
jgi:hypothetical protein